MLSFARRRPIATAMLTVLIVTCLASGVFAIQLVAQVISAATPPPAVHFDHGLTPPDLRAPKKWTNEYCGTCHKAEFEQWSKSRHAVSGTTHNFEVEFLEPDGGRQQHCLNCHAPRNPTGELFPTEEPIGIDAAYKEQHSWVKDGIDCLTCHVRNGEVLVTRNSAKAAAAHPIRVAPELGKAEFCAGCHQFSFKSHVLPDGYFGQLQQASFEEFLDFRANGGAETSCQDCHMPDGDHTIPGGYDDEMLRSAVDLDIRAEWKESLRQVFIEVDISAGHVGHRVPGGEHFRFLTVHTSVNDGDGKEVIAPSNESTNHDDLVSKWPQIEMLRREMGPAEQGSDNPEDQPNPDTRLWPNEIRTYRYRMAIDPTTLLAPLKIRAELWYHLMHQSKAESFGHSLDEVKRMVLSKEASLRFEDVAQ